MAAFIHPIAWLLETLRLWRERRTLALDDEMADHIETADLYREYRERSIPIWFLLPPC